MTAPLFCPATPKEQSTKFKQQQLLCIVCRASPEVTVAFAEVPSTHSENFVLCVEVYHLHNGNFYDSDHWRSCASRFDFGGHLALGIRFGLIRLHECSTYDCRLRPSRFPPADCRPNDLVSVPGQVHQDDASLQHGQHHLRHRLSTSLRDENESASSYCLFALNCEMFSCAYRSEVGDAI
ncbi:hypothetical protein RvY_19282-2 [Ramazzottius varieornatus]|uniref:Uncharacterized protein n=1 Tax=Ramazzottius varieornatus TaxID=947166 RepID=A0A1D1W8W8_RAMVA|nr:hypothetical protein RvY_19282-2 [Ramazzottius varieornatus]